MKKLLSRRISRLSSLDHSTLDHVNDDDEEQMEYNTSGHTYGSNMLTTSNHHQQQQQQLLPQLTTLQSPAKPMAPYALFFRDTMTAIKQQNPVCTLEQITAISLNMWEAMDEKQKSVYDQRHEQDKREYLRQLRDYQRNQLLGESTATTTTTDQQQLPPVTGLTNSAESSAPAIADAEPAKSTEQAPPPEQIQLLTEAAAVQKCTRDQCNKPAIINPDWEDEYCSNECVVIHCRNVFSEWARSLQNSPT